MAGPLRDADGEFGSTHHQRLETSMVDPLGGGAEIRERTPSTLKTSTVGPVGGDAGDSGVSTIKAKKR
jgi:hypothetical protein